MTVNGVRFIGADVRPRAIAAGSGEAVEVASADADSEILLNYSSVVHPFFVESDRPVPRLLSVGVPSRLAALGIPLHKGDATGVDPCKDLKDSRQFKETMVPPPPLYLSSSLHSCPPWRCSSTGRRRGPTNLWTPSLRRCTPPSLLCRQRRRSRRGFWSSLRGRRAAGAGRAVQVRLQRKTSPLAPRDGESMGRPLRS
jgi:hypothetical protein